MNAAISRKVGSDLFASNHGDTEAEPTCHAPQPYPVSRAPSVWRALNRRNLRTWQHLVLDVIIKRAPCLLTLKQTLVGQRATIDRGQVSDEKSSIQWLRQLLSDRHLTYQEIQPRLLQELSTVATN